MGDGRLRRNGASKVRLRLNERDIELLVTLLLHRAMSRQHLQELFFGSLSRANYRLAQLRKVGLIRVVDVPFATLGAITVYAATKLAVDLVGHSPRIGGLRCTAPESISNLDHTLKSATSRSLSPKLAKPGICFSMTGDQS